MLLLFFHPLISFGQQEEKVVIEGVVVDADSAQVLPSVHLRIPNTSLGGVTSPDGRFKTRVYPHDSIVFSSVGYQPYLLVLADSMAQSRRKLVIRMTPQVTMLEEVKIKEYVDITKYIKYKIDSTVDMRRPKGTPLFEKSAPKERKAVQMSAGPNGARLEGAVTAFANLFSDEHQQKKKLKELLAAQEAQAQQQALRKEMVERYQMLVLDVVDFNDIELQRFTAAYMPNPFAMVAMSDYVVTSDIIQNLKKHESQEVFLEELLDKGVFEGQEHIK